MSPSCRQLLTFIATMQAVVILPLCGCRSPPGRCEICMIGSSSCGRVSLSDFACQPSSCLLVSLPLVVRVVPAFRVRACVRACVLTCLLGDVIYLYYFSVDCFLLRRSRPRLRVKHYDRERKRETEICPLSNSHGRHDRRIQHACTSFLPRPFFLLETVLKS